MPTRRRTPKPTPRRAAVAKGGPRRTEPCPACRRRFKRLEAELAAERERHGRQLVAVRRAADRRLAAMMTEIAALRHFQARAEALERLLAQRDAAVPLVAGGETP